MKKKKIPHLYRILKCVIKLCYPTVHVEHAENIPDEPVILVGNHAQMHGPLTCELYPPGPCYTWCVGDMMQVKTVPTYAYQDFWSGKPGYSRWFYKLLSYIIAVPAAYLFRHANTIAVYRDTRILGTFKSTVQRLEEGNNIIIFPEHKVPHNAIVYEFQNNFVDVARLYYKRTGKTLQFVPFYIAPELKTMYIGKPIPYDVTQPAQQRQALCEQMMQQITDMATQLPRHRVVPYENVPKKCYPMNRQEEDQPIA